MTDEPSSSSGSSSHEIQQGPTAEYAGVDLPEARQEDESTVDWFARSLGKPSPSELADMLRWTQGVLIDENVLEYQMRWITRSVDVLNQLDDLLHYDSFQMKRTMLLVVMADYLGKPRKHVFDREETAGRLAFDNWMKKPELKGVFDQLHGMMEEEVLNHELASVKEATTVTRISAAKAAKVRMQLLDHPNPWVQLQAARDIMQAADKATASKGGSTNWNIHAQLSSEQVDQLLQQATSELREWQDIAAPGEANGRPLVIIEQDTEPNEHDIARLTDGMDKAANDD